MPQHFYVGAEGSDSILDKADDGTPLVDRREWECRMCDTLYSLEPAAEQS
jgi:hypothetical protein